MIYTRKLIQVARPLDGTDSESAREKSIRHGHPSTLHLWWARWPPIADSGVGENRLRFTRVKGGVRGGPQAENASMAQVH
jgi:hypothetical protein